MKQYITYRLQRHTFNRNNKEIVIIFEETEGGIMIEAFENLIRSYGESGTLSPYDNNTKLLYSLLYDLKNI